jgi:polysaccharide export outer membrane protein
LVIVTIHPAPRVGAIGISAVAMTLLTTTLCAQSPPAAPPADKDLVEDLQRLNQLWPAGRYRITPGDVLELAFPLVAEFNQTVTVQPDGYIALRGISEIPAAGHMVSELKENITTAYAAILRDPVITVILKDFEKPYFVVAGEVSKPGRYELRGAVTLTQALAIAGGPSSGGKKSGVILFRRHSDETVEAKEVDLQKMYAKHDLSEDPVLRPGDTLFVPKTRMSSIAPYIPKPGIGLFRPF